MICSLIGPNLYQYQFPPEEGHLYGFNLYALLSGDEALLIDTAYKEQAAEPGRPPPMERDATR